MAEEADFEEYKVAIDKLIDDHVTMMLEAHDKLADEAEAIHKKHCRKTGAEAERCLAKFMMSFVALVAHEMQEKSRMRQLLVEINKRRAN